MQIFEYTPEKYHILATPSGLRKIQFGASSNECFSSKLTLPDITSKNKHCIDSNWNTGAKYLCSGYDGKLYKISTTTTYKTFTNITNICVLQNIDDITMERVWIVDNNKLKLLDEDLEVIKTISNLSEVKKISSDPYGNCYIIDNGFEKIFKVSSEGKIVFSVGFANLTPTIDSTNIPIDIKVDGNDNIYILSSKYVYKCQISASNIFSVSRYLDIYSQLNPAYSASEIEIDIYNQEFAENESSSSEDFFNCAIYVSGGSSDHSAILKLDKNVNVVKKVSFENYGFPYMMRVSQQKYSKNLFLLTDKNKYNTQEYYNSSSSDTESSSESEDIENNIYFLQINKDLTLKSELEIFKNGNEDVFTIGIDNSEMTTKSTTSTLAFTFSSFEKHTPLLNKEEFSIVIPQTISISERNIAASSNLNNDNGDYNQANIYPAKPLNTSGLFTELKGRP